MKKATKTAGICLLCLFLTFSLFSREKIKEKDLAEKYRDFLKLTRYIILPQEKEVFMQLATDRDKDIFIETLWKQRDPTPGTPQNEYKDEHIKRFKYANKFYKRGTVREGWMTDMGRFYIILGPPVSIERFEGTLGLYPTQVWYYYGEKKKGLPPHFALVFYQRGGFGEYKLYDHVSDGPASLMVHSRGMAIFDYGALYEKIRELAPTLADVSISMIPGEIPLGYQPSPRNLILLAEIIESPKKDVNPSYATHFLDYKGMVSTEYMTNYIESDAHVALIQDPLTGMNFLHFSIAPKSLSIDYFEPKDQYFFNFQISVSLRIEDNIIFQYTRGFPFYFSPEDLSKVKGNGIAIEDSFPVIKGKYKLIILLQNSVGKEFSILEKEIFVPEESESPRITGLLLGYKFQSYQQNLHIPFKVLDKKLVVDPTNTFSSTDNISFFFNFSNITQDLWKEGKVKVFIKSLKPNNPSQKSFIINLSSYPYRRILFVTHTIAPEELAPDYYEMKLSLIDEKGETIDERGANFIISPIEIISHPIAYSKPLSLSNKFLYFYMLAAQHERVREYEKAESFFQKAYELEPDYKKGLIGYAHFLFKVKKFDKSLELIKNIEDDEKLKFEYYLIKGRAFMGMGKYSEAIENLLEGNKIYDSDTALLNSLGFCYSNTGQKEKALDALKASLRLNPEQTEMKKLIEEIEKSPK